MRAAITRGLAPGYEITRALSPSATRISALQTRPCTRIRPRTDVDRTGFYCGHQVGRRRTLHASFNFNLLLVAPPQSFKTGYLARIVARLPGGGVVTSTRANIWTLTAPHRDHLPSRVCNPEGLGGVPSDVRYGPQYGCADPDQAFLRAGYLLAGDTKAGTSGDRKYWIGRASVMLRYLLHAADLDDALMSTVATWARQPAGCRAIEVLLEHPQAAPGWGLALRAMSKLEHRTLVGITEPILSALGFLDSPALRAAANCTRSESLDIAALIRARGLLFLLGTSKEHSPLSPYFGCLTADVYETAKAIADRSPGDRLDPPFPFVLDEAYHIARVPIEQWTGTSAGSGLPIFTSVQAPAQMHSGWGSDEAKIMQTNHTVHIYGGGIVDEDHLTDLATIIGDRAGPDDTHRVPVLTAAQIREQEPGEAVLLHRNLGAVRVKIECIWDLPGPASKEERLART